MADAKEDGPEERAAEGRLETIEEVDEAGARVARYVVTGSGAVKRQKTAHHQPDKPPALRDHALSIWRQLLAVFLPAGYPNSVTEDYLNYQIYDSLQAFCSSIAGLLSSRAVLEGVGVGDAAANPTSALLLTVLQESVGRLATILFAHRLGTSLEPECKTYRLAADIFNDAAMILDCLSPALPKPVRVTLLSGSSVLRALCGVAAGSAKASLSAHFAKRGNLGEVNAKDSSQETVISLLGMLAGTVVVSTVTSTWATWTCLLLLLAAHLALNYRAVRSVQMTTLNRQRANIVLSHLFTDRSSTSTGTSRTLTPAIVAEHEHIFGAADNILRSFSFATDDDDHNSQAGSSLLVQNQHQAVTAREPVGRAMLGAPFSRVVSALKGAKMRASELLAVFEGEMFVLWRCSDEAGSGGETLVCLKDGASAEDALKAWALALWFAPALARSRRRDGRSALKLLGISLDSVNGRWPGYADRLRAAGWDLDVGSLETGKARRLRFRKED